MLLRSLHDVALNQTLLVVDFIKLQNVMKNPPEKSGGSEIKKNKRSNHCG